MDSFNLRPDYCRLLSRLPNAVAIINGSTVHEGIYGLVRFYRTMAGVLVSVEVSGLPVSTERCKSNIFGFHIHSGSSCVGNESPPFPYTGGHYNPENCPHPAHSGDLPPLFGCAGHAFSAFLTDKFTVDEILGRTIVIHSRPDDFISQPTGNSGEKIACGIIEAVRRR